MRNRTSDSRFRIPDSGFRAPILDHWATDGHMTRVLHTAKISKVDMWLSSKASQVWGSIHHWDSELFSLSHAREKTKNIFLYFFTELKT